MCGGKEVKTRVCSQEASAGKAFERVRPLSIPPAEDRAFPEYNDCSGNGRSSSQDRPYSAFPYALLLGPPQGRALRLPSGSASLRTNGPSPRLLFPRPRANRGVGSHAARQRGLRLTPHPSRLTFSNFPPSTFRFHRVDSYRPYG